MAIRSFWGVLILHIYHTCGLGRAIDASHLLESPINVAVWHLRGVLALLELLVNVVALLANLIIIGGPECTRICRSIALQFSVNPDLTVARLVDVTRTRLFVDETDYRGLTVRVRMEFGHLGLLLELILLLWRLAFLLVLLLLGCHFLGCISSVICLNTYFAIFASRLRIVPGVIFCHNFLNLRVKETLARPCVLTRCLLLVTVVKRVIDL